MVEWEYPQPPDLGLDLPGAPKVWLEAIREWGSKENHITAIYLFGSRLRQDFRNDSDLDLAILLSGRRDCDPEQPFWKCNQERIARELGELVPVPIHLNVLHLKDWDDTTQYVRDTGV